MPIDLAGKRILIFIVAYNAEKTISSVLQRIPEELRCREVEVLIIDDSSKDETFRAGLKHEAAAVFGSRMINKQDALKGGMPLYKWVGNQVLTTFQNALLGSSLSEFH